MVTTLHIEHPVSSLDAWGAAFARFDDARRTAGVLAHRACHPVGDDHYVVVELDFDDDAGAQAFEAFLRDRVWARPEASPALAGEPVTRLYHAVGG